MTPDHQPPPPPIRRVVLTGSESTGKTTLAARLAEHFGTVWVPEHVRDYLDRKASPLDAADVEPIARGQMAAEDEGLRRAARLGRDLVVLDTDLLSTVVYAGHYYGAVPPWLEDEADRRAADLYLLADIDAPWVPDPQRDRPGQRAEMQALFRAALARTGRPTVLIAGSRDERFQRAVAAVESMRGR